MVSVIVAIVRGDDLEGDFDLVSEVALESTVRDFKERLKLWSLRLANIEAGLMTIYGPFGTEPDDDEVPHLLKEKGKRCHIADTLSSLIGAGMERAYFLVRITVPVVAPAAVAGAGAPTHVPSSAVDVASCSMRLLCEMHNPLCTRIAGWTASPRR